MHARTLVRGRGGAWAAWARAGRTMGGSDATWCCSAPTVRALRAELSDAALRGARGGYAWVPAGVLLGTRRGTLGYGPSSATRLFKADLERILLGLPPLPRGSKISRQRAKAQVASSHSLILILILYGHTRRLVPMLCPTNENLCEGGYPNASLRRRPRETSWVKQETGT